MYTYTLKVNINGKLVKYECNDSHTFEDIMTALTDVEHFYMTYKDEEEDIIYVTNQQEYDSMLSYFNVGINSPPNTTVYVEFVLNKDIPALKLKKPHPYLSEVEYKTLCHDLSNVMLEKDRSVSFLCKFSRYVVLAGIPKSWIDQKDGKYVLLFNSEKEDLFIINMNNVICTSLNIDMHKLLSPLIDSNNDNVNEEVDDDKEYGVVEALEEIFISEELEKEKNESNKTPDVYVEVDEEEEDNSENVEILIVEDSEDGEEDGEEDDVGPIFYCGENEEKPVSLDKAIDIILDMGLVGRYEAMKTLLNSRTSNLNIIIAKLIGKHKLYA